MASAAMQSFMKEGEKVSERQITSGGRAAVCALHAGPLGEAVLLGVQGCNLGRCQAHEGVAQQLGPAQAVVGILVEQTLPAHGQPQGIMLLCQAT